MLLSSISKKRLKYPRKMIRFKLVPLILLLIVAYTATAQKKNEKTDSIYVYGECGQCKDRIEKTLKRMNVYASNWDIDSKILVVTYDSNVITREQIERKMAFVGHDTKIFKADDRTYSKLPDCCHYEREGSTSTPNINTDHKEETHQLSNQEIGGTVLELVNGKSVPLYGALVRVTGTQKAIYTDSLGAFSLRADLPAQIVISYLGYLSDTIEYKHSELLTITLQTPSTNTLKEVQVYGRMQTSYVSAISTLNTLNISSKELTKAACCNLSESFETSPSIDVSYSDAVTGIKQIQLLGLSGNYTMLTTENIPEIKGLPGSYGLTFIPGPWLEGIQVTKGTGSVANGYESIAGQINIEEKKPDKMEKFYLNIYNSSMGRMEASMNFSKRLNNRWSTALLTHINGVFIKTDGNNDGFLDIPIGRQFNIVNRWKYLDSNGLIAQFSLKALNDYRQAGEFNFNPVNDKLKSTNYGVGIAVQQYSFTGKVGYVFPEKPYKSIGFMISGTLYDDHAYYGLRTYNASQQSIYANFIYQSIFGNTMHNYRTGLSYINEQYVESLNTNGYKRNEIVPGAFFEYTFTPNPKFSTIIGLRADYHSYFGWITTPRIHLKYDINLNNTLRFSGGSGFKMANIFAENTNYFVSSRQYIIKNPMNGYGYGLNPEKAWNYGMNFLHQFRLYDRAGTMSIDAYQTQFINQVVVDLDANPNQVLFYNLKGPSYSNSVQAELNYELLSGLSMRMAYRWLDVKTTYDGGLKSKPFIASHRAFINLAYETISKWKYDITAQWLSGKRLPDTRSNPQDYQLGSYSPAYMQVSAQVSKQFNTKMEVYIGVENLTNYVQPQLILSNAQPFGQYFDASMIWGPVNGRLIYIGLRYGIK